MMTCAVSSWCWCRAGSCSRGLDVLSSWLMQSWYGCVIKLVHVCMCCRAGSCSHGRMCYQAGSCLYVLSSWFMQSWSGYVLSSWFMLSWSGCVIELVHVCMCCRAGSCCRGLDVLSSWLMSVCVVELVHAVVVWICYQAGSCLYVLSSWFMLSWSGCVLSVSTSSSDTSRANR